MGSSHGIHGALVGCHGIFLVMKHGREIPWVPKQKELLNGKIIELFWGEIPNAIELIFRGG
jgi:hypothetical protein